MTQTPEKPLDTRPWLDVHMDDGFPARLVPAQMVPALPADLTVAGPRRQVRTHTMGRIVVLDVDGRLSDVVEDLDHAIRLALAEEPRGVACDLSAVLDAAAPAAIRGLASAGRHVRDWSGTPVAMVCPDPAAREALSALPLGGYLTVTASMPLARSALLETTEPTVEGLRLAPHPTAPRASRQFVTRTLQDWGLEHVVPTACLVVSELVTNAIVHAGTDVELSVAVHEQALRLTVRDSGAGLPIQSGAQLEIHGRGLAVVAAISRAWGVLPTPGVGKVVWAVLDAFPDESD